MLLDSNIYSVIHLIQLKDLEIEEHMYIESWTVLPSGALRFSPFIL